MSPVTWDRCRDSVSKTQIELIVFSAVAIGAVELSAYGFNLDGEDPFAVVALAVEF